MRLRAGVHRYADSGSTQSLGPLPGDSSSLRRKRHPTRPLELCESLHFFWCVVGFDFRDFAYTFVVQGAVRSPHTHQGGAFLQLTLGL
jgi:hypothetical protein